MSGCIGDVAAQHLAMITPIHEIQVAADIAERLIHSLDIQIRCLPDLCQQRILNSRRQLRIAMYFVFPANFIGHIAYRQRHQLSITIFHQHGRAFDLDQRTVLMANETALQRQIALLFDFLQKVFYVFGRIYSDMIQRQRCSALQHITEAFAKPDIGLQDFAGIGIANSDRFRRLFHYRPIPRFAIRQRLFHLLANRNIARNPQNANQFPGSIPHRRFDRFHQHPFAAIRKHNPFLIYTGPAREHRLAVMLPERIRQFFIDKIIIGLANNFFFPGAKKPFKRRIAG